MARFKVAGEIEARDAEHAWQIVLDAARPLNHDGTFAVAAVTRTYEEGVEDGRNQAQRYVAGLREKLLLAELVELRSAIYKAYPYELPPEITVALRNARQEGEQHGRR